MSEYKVSAAQVSVITSGDIYYIRNIKSGLYLDVSGGSPECGTNVQIWDANTSSAQRWAIYDLSNGYSVLRTATNLWNALDVNSGYTSDWSNIDVWCVTDNNNNVPDYAQWKLIDNGDGTFRFASKCSSDQKCLDTYYGNTSSGTNVIQYTYNGDANMKWSLESTSRDILLDQPFCQIDSGDHLDIDADDTQYTAELDYAINIWNSYKPGVIRYDAWDTIEDVFIQDDSTLNPPAFATTSLDGTITLYSTHLNKFTIDQRRKTIAHEIGHTLGLDENNTFPYGDSKNLKGNIMGQGQYGIISLSRNDKAGYDVAINWP